MAATGEAAMTTRRLLCRESLIMKEVGTAACNDGDNRGNLLFEIPGSY